MTDEHTVSLTITTPSQAVAAHWARRLADMVPDALNAGLGTSADLTISTDERRTFNLQGNVFNIEATNETVFEETVYEDEG